MEFMEHPGRLCVVATLLPLASFVLLLLLGAIRNAARPYRQGGLGQSIYWACGGDVPTKVGAYVATVAIGLSCVLCVTGLFWFLSSPAGKLHEHGAAHAHEHEHADAAKADEKEGGDHHHDADEDHSDDWAERITFLRVSALKPDSDPRGATELQLGYRIDHLSAVMFVMVTFVATLIHIFSAGYMADELQPLVEDHQVHGEGGGHFKRRGRYSRFFMYLSLFCFSMLNLVLADNLFQIFVSWELVGICSFLLIGFYYERQSASDAANKAFITNRIGDAGFIIGLLVIWTYVGTFNFQEIFERVRPDRDTHGDPVAAEFRHQFVRGTTAERDGGLRFSPDQGGDQVLLIKPGHRHNDDIKDGMRVQKNLDNKHYGLIPYILLTIAGLGIFTGCVGKSAQFPLHVWLPDAMEGPTPVSALIHAATMVAAGVYLVGRVFPLFTEEARLVIAYTGGITLFVAATIAIVMNDIKKVLAYSTVSQLGYMMLALGVGGWIAGLMHLLTHAFFKALLFLGSGSVIYGCHHEQDMRKMGGLFKKMPITATTMLVGVLAIAGTPFFSGWYSKDAIIAQGLGFSAIYKRHGLLLILPLVTAGITTFYMFRMWFLTFTGEPKDHHVHEHAHESPKLMTVPLILLAVFSLGVAWGWPLWDPESSYLHKLLHAAEPASVAADFHAVERLLDDPGGWVHPVAGLIAFLAAGIGALFAFLVYHFRTLDAAETKEQFGFLYRLFDRKWYFDELYSALLVRPALVVAHWCRAADAKGIDGIIDGLGRTTVRVARGSGRFDNGVVDGLVNVVGNVIRDAGSRLRRIQTGSLRNYIVFLVLAAIGIFAVLSYFLNTAAGSQ
jgi:NADH-quinone oxidoreductase subunit L